MKLTLKHALAAIILVLSFAAPVGAGPLDDAYATYARGDYATALRLYRPLADQGDASAQTALGIMYRNGQGGSPNDAEAAKWYRKAADQGNAIAQFNLGIMYRNGQGVRQNDFEAIKWYRKAADQGNATAQINLGAMYDDGTLAVLQNDAEAIKWYRKAADQGNALGQFNLGNMYRNGQGVPQDHVRAHMWFSLSAAQGGQAAVASRDTVAGRMTPAQIAEAQKLAREWKPTK